MSLLDIAQIELLFIIALFFPLIIQLIVLTIISRMLWNFTHRQFGYRVWALFAFIGVPIHELSHALAFLLTGAGVSKMVLFAPKGLPEYGGATGVVIPKHNPSIPSLMVASIAPLFGCTLLAWLVLTLLLPDSVGAQGLTILDVQNLNEINLMQTIVTTFSAYLTSMFDTLVSIDWGNWRTYIAFFIAASLGMGAAPSNADLKYFFPAVAFTLVILFPVFAIIVALGNTEAALLTLQSILGQLTFSISVAINYATLFAFIALVLLWIISLFKRGLMRRRRRV